MTDQTLPKYDLQDLADELVAFGDRAGEAFVYWLRTQKLLLEGRPVSPEQMVAHLHISPDEVSTLLRGTELDQDGNVVGWGLSLVSTPHAYRIGDRQFYVWCANDAITFPIFLKANAVIESPDPISGDKVRLLATSAGVQLLEPSTAVVSWPWETGTGTLEDVRTWACDMTHFFTSVETASQYVAQHPGLVIVPVDEVFRLWNRVWDREPYHSLIADL